MEQRIIDRIQKSSAYKSGKAFSVKDAGHQLGETFDAVSITQALYTMVHNGQLRLSASDTRQNVNMYRRFSYTNIMCRKWVTVPSPTEYSPKWVYHDESMR